MPDEGQIILCKDDVKREITLPFQMCISKEDAHWLRDQLRQAVADDFTWGWITIASKPGHQGGVNQAPRKWTE